MRLLATLLVCFFSSLSWAQQPAQSSTELPPFSESLPHSSRASVLIAPLTHKTITPTTNWHSQQFFPPASTMKLLTAVAAKLQLGNAFVYKTRIDKQDNHLIVQFSGDPTLTRHDLSTLLSQVKQRIGSTIDGDIWLNDSAFNGYERAIGWPWDILGVCYSAPSSAITLDHNCVQGSIYSQTNGKTRTFVPRHQPIQLHTDANSVSLQQQQRSGCRLELTANSDNNYQLSGCMVKQKDPLPLNFAIQDTHAYTRHIIEQLLSELNITLKGRILIGQPKSSSVKQTLARHQSAPLPTLLKQMLHKSDNLIADNLLKTIGGQFYAQAGSFNNGTLAVKALFKQHANIDLSSAQLVDGSGLSRNNRLTANMMADVLHYIWQNDHTLNLIALMPIAGKSGTLKYRHSMQKSAIKGHIIAKSGSLYGTYNMAGFGLNKQGTPRSIFVQYISDYFIDKTKRNAGVSLSQYEQTLYRQVINSAQ